MEYNKKQMQPVIDKFQIDPNKNKVFANIVTMFEDSKNYQVWAVKSVFSKAISLVEMEAIKNWIAANKNNIKRLSKQNIVQYVTADDFKLLATEINGINFEYLIKHTISCFNPEQKKMLQSFFFKTELTPQEMGTNKTFEKWSKIFEKFNKISSNRKGRFYQSASGIKDLDTLFKAINNCLKEAYDWSKDELLLYIENLDGCEVVYDNGPIVILKVTKFATSNALCGNGRTTWCIAREERYFNDYVLRDGRQQFFLFDFSRKETDSFAHIGFTIENKQGIIYAHSCENKDLNSSYISVNGENIDIHKALKKINVDLGNFFNFKLMEYEWNANSFLESIKKYKDDVKLKAALNNVIIVEVDRNGLSKIVGHTFINLGNLQLDSSHAIFAILDFNKPKTSVESITLAQFSKDIYGAMSPYKAINSFGKDVQNFQEYFKKLGIDVDSMFCTDNIDPKILLHKYINEDKEESAIKHLEKYWNEIDVNYEFNQLLPIFSAINSRMFNLFKKILHHPKYNSSLQDGFGDTLLESLIYLYGTSDIDVSADDIKLYEEMIKEVLECETFDLNAKDYNNDTPLTSACEYKKAAWFVKKLTANPKVDVNCVNDFDCSALTNALSNENTEAVQYLLARKDLKIRSVDEKLAKECGIKLEATHDAESAYAIAN